MRFNRSRLFKVIDLCTNRIRKPITYDILLVIMCDLGSILHRFRDTTPPKKLKTTLPQSEPPIEETPSNFAVRHSRLKDETLSNILVRMSWWWLQPFCHNTLVSQTTTDRQTTWQQHCNVRLKTQQNHGHMHFISVLVFRIISSILWVNFCCYRFYNYTVSQKWSHFYFLNNSVKKEPILIIFATLNPEGTWH